MYYKNDKSVGFFVTRQNWRRSLVARVISIAGQTSGPLKGLGRYPYFDLARDQVFVEMYEFVDNKLTRILPAEHARHPDREMLGILSCPGTFKYELRTDIPGNALDYLSD